MGPYRDAADALRRDPGRPSDLFGARVNSFPLAIGARMFCAFLDSYSRGSAGGAAPADPAGGGSDRGPSWPEDARAGGAGGGGGSAANLNKAIKTTDGTTGIGPGKKARRAAARPRGGVAGLRRGRPNGTAGERLRLPGTVKERGAGRRRDSQCPATLSAGTRGWEERRRQGPPALSWMRPTRGMRSCATRSGEPGSSDAARDARKPPRRGASLCEKPQIHGRAARSGHLRSLDREFLFLPRGIIRGCLEANRLHCIIASGARRRLGERRCACPGYADARSGRARRARACGSRAGSRPAGARGAVTSPRPGARGAFANRRMRPGLRWRKMARGAARVRPHRYSSSGHDLAGTSMLPELVIHERLPVNSRSGFGFLASPSFSDFSPMLAGAPGGI